MARLTARALRNLGHSMSSQTSQLLSWADEQQGDLASDAGDSGSLPPWLLTGESSGELGAARPLSHTASPVKLVNNLQQQRQQQQHQHGGGGGGGGGLHKNDVSAGDSPQLSPPPLQPPQRRQWWGLDWGSGVDVRGAPAVAEAPGWVQGSSFWASALAWFDADLAEEAAGEGERSVADVEAGRQLEGQQEAAVGGQQRQQQQQDRWQQRTERSRREWQLELGVDGGVDRGGGPAGATPSTDPSAAAVPPAAATAAAAVPAVPAAAPQTHGKPPIHSPFAAAAASIASIAASTVSDASPEGAFDPQQPPTEVQQEDEQQQQQQQQQEGQPEGGQPTSPIALQRSLLFDEVSQEVYKERMRRSTYSFIINQGGVRQRRKGGGAGNGRSTSVAPSHRITAGHHPAASSGGKPTMRPAASAAAAAAGAAARTGGTPGVNFPKASHRLSPGNFTIDEEGWEVYTPGNAAAQAPLVRDILPLLARARALLPSARAEPAWLVAGGGVAAPGGQAAWAQLLDASERLAMR